MTHPRRTATRRAASQGQQRGRGRGHHLLVLRRRHLGERRKLTLSHGRSQTAALQRTLCGAAEHARYVSVSDCASVTNDDVNIAAVVSPDDDTADQAERSQATQSSKAASAARPAECSQASKAAWAAEPRHISISQAEAPSEDIRGSAVSEAVRPMKEEPLSSPTPQGAIAAV